jgi:uncharacterized membrane protein (UPF0127 family)
MEQKPPLRLRRLPAGALADVQVPVATNLIARLLGLAMLRRSRAGAGLMFLNCRSVHTFGMLFALDVYFIDGRGRVLRVATGVAPGRILFDRRATGILEIPSGRTKLLEGSPVRAPGFPDRSAEGGESFPAEP